MTDPLDRARRLLDLGRYAEAADQAAAHLATDPESPAALAVLAVALLETEQWPRAVEVTERLVAAAPDSSLGHRLASTALQGSRRHVEAVGAARTAVGLGPLDAANHVRLALAGHQVRAHRQEARAAAEQAVRLAPYDDDAHFAAGLTARRRPEQRAAYRRALALNPAHAPAANNELVSRGRTWSLRTLVEGYLGVLGGDPGFEKARENLVALTFRFVRRYYVAGVVLLALTALQAALTDSFDRWSAVRCVGGAVALVAMAAYAVGMYRAVPPGPRHYLARAWRSRPLLIATTVHALAVVGAALVALTVPGATAPALGVGVLLLYANLALALWGGVASLVRRARR